MTDQKEIAGIVQRMKDAGEPNDNIKKVVAIWDKEQASANVIKPPPMFGNPLTGLKTTWDQFKGNVEATVPPTAPEQPVPQYHLGQFGMMTPSTPRAAQASLGGLHGAASMATMPMVAPLNVAGAFLPRLSQSLGRFAGKALTENPEIQQGQYGPVANPLPGLMEMYGKVKEKWPRATQVVGDVATLASAKPVVGLEKAAAGSVIKPVAKAVGKPTEGLGRFWLERQLGISKTEAKKAGATPLEGIENTIENISKYGLDSPMGMDAAKGKTIDLIKLESNNADNLMKRAVTNPKNALKSVDVDNMVLGVMEDIKDAPGLMLKQDQAQTILGNIHKELEAKGLTGPQFVDKIPAIKKTVAEGLGLFKKGPFNIAEDPLPAQMGEKIYFRMMEAVNKEIPDLKETNKKISQLIRIKGIMEDAQFRAKSTGKDLRGILAESVVGAGGTAIASHGNIPAAIIAGVAAPVTAHIAKTAGPSLLMKTGRALQGKRTLKNLVGDLTPEEQAALKYNISKRKISVGVSNPNFVYTRLPGNRTMPSYAMIKR